jgi:RecB family endonuclease NucS
VLGEKAFPEGHVDILIKDHSPAGYCRKLVIEVKIGVVQKRDIEQLHKYMTELGEECKKGRLLGKKISKKSSTKLRTKTFSVLYIILKTLIMKNYIHSTSYCQI